MMHTSRALVPPVAVKYIETLEQTPWGGSPRRLACGRIKTPRLEASIIACQKRPPGTRSPRSFYQDKNMETIRYTNRDHKEAQDKEYFLTSDINKTFAKKVYHEYSNEYSYYIRLDQMGEPFDPASLNEYISSRDLRADIRYKQVSKDLFYTYLSFLNTKSSAARSQITRQMIQ